MQLFIGLSVQGPYCKTASQRVGEVLALVKAVSPKSSARRSFRTTLQIICNLRAYE